MGPELQMPSSLVTVWATLSPFVQVMAWPGATVIGDSNVKLAMRVSTPDCLPYESSGCSTILRGCFPTGMVATTWRCSTSTTETSPESSLVTYAVSPSGSVAIQCGALPTRIVASTS